MTAPTWRWHWVDTGRRFHLLRCIDTQDRERNLRIRTELGAPSTARGMCGNRIRLTKPSLVGPQNPHTECATCWRMWVVGLDAEATQRGEGTRR